VVWLTSVIFVPSSLLCARRTPHDVKSQRYVGDPGRRIDLDAQSVDGTGQRVGHNRRGVVVGREHELKHRNNNPRESVVRES